MLKKKKDRCPFQVTSEQRDVFKLCISFRWFAYFEMAATQVGEWGGVLVVFRFPRSSCPCVKVSLNTLNLKYLQLYVDVGKQWKLLWINASENVMLDWWFGIKLLNNHSMNCLSTGHSYTLFWVNILSFEFDHFNVQKMFSSWCYVAFSQVRIGTNALVTTNTIKTQIYINIHFIKCRLYVHTLCHVSIINPAKQKSNLCTQTIPLPIL